MSEHLKPAILAAQAAVSGGKALGRAAEQPAQRPGAPSLVRAQKTRGPRRGKWLIPALAALVIVVVALLVWPGQGPKVPVAAVEPMNLNQTITANGHIEPIAPVIARAEFPAFVDQVAASAGQAVHRGQMILTLRSSDVAADLARTRADLISAQAALANARAGGPPAERAELEANLRVARSQVAALAKSQQDLESLLKDQAATRTQVAQNQAKLTQAQAARDALEAKQKAMQQQAALDAQSNSLRVAQDQAAIHSLEQQLQSATVISSLDGTLYSLPKRPGDYVQTGEVLAEMADLRKVRVRADVDEPDVGLLAPNEPVELTWDARPGEAWRGETEQTPKQIIKLEDRSVGEVLCSVDNSKLELLPGVNVEVRIIVRQSRGTLAVPRAAVRYDNGQHFVWVVADNAVQRRNITVGVASPEDYEVLSGLKQGERVAIPDGREMRPGMSIRPVAAR